MSASLILAAIWAIASTIVALLPMRHQFGPGVPLLLSAPLTIIFIGYQHGAWIAALGLFAFLSMFRRPLMYLGRKALGLPAPLPPEIKGKDP